MTSKRHKGILIYIITIVTTFVLVGGTALYFYLKINQKQPIIDADVSDDEQLKIDITSEFNRTMLLILNAGESKSDKVFVVTRFIAPEKKLVILSVSSDTIAQVNTQKDTIYNYYQKGGAIGVSTAIENALDIKIPKYMEFDKQAFQSISDILGGSNYYIPYDLVNENEETGESVVIRAGQQYLDGIRLRQFFTFPEFHEGEQYRSKAVGICLADMLNASLGDRLVNTLDTTFNTIINQVKTNVSAYDYKYRKDAILNTIKEEKYPCQYSTCSGTYNADNNFVIDDSFKDDLKKLFELNT